jgi:hypothetical protein
VEPVRRVIAARQAGDHAEALRLLLEIVADLRREHPALPMPPFGVLFEWRLVMEAYAPARDALAALRDEHVRRLLDSDIHGGQADVDDNGHSRFWNIAWLNDTLQDQRSTYEVFLHLAEALPGVAERYAWRALPAIVAERDYALGARYLPEPLDDLFELNATARFRPLFPTGHQAPLLSALLSNFCRNVSLRVAILAGLGRSAEAQAFRAEALAGIVSGELRQMAERELASPGTMATLMGAHVARQPPPVR